jgi:hypothetical protein
VTSRTFVVGDDLYRVQRRPGHPHVIVNDGYRGLRVIEPRAEIDIARVPFPADYGRFGVVGEWCFRADGQQALVLDEDNRLACWLSLGQDLASFMLEYPPLRGLFDLRYSWEGNALWLKAGKSEGLLQLSWDGNRPALTPVSSIAARTQVPGWRNAVEQLPTQGTNVLRVESDRRRMLYHRYSPDPAMVGIYSWRRKKSSRLPPMMGVCS